MGKYMYGQRRTWKEIINSKNEYETKAMSHFNYLKNNGISIYVGKYGEEIDLDRYMQGQVEKYGKIYLTTSDKFSLSDLTKYEYKLQKVKDELDGYIDCGLREDNNIPQYFVKAYTEMRYLEDLVRKSKISVDQQERIQEVFGNFTTKKGVDEHGYSIYKSSQELTEERNARLAILNDLYNDKKLEEAQFINDVKAVLDCYNIDIQNSLDREVKASEKEKSDSKLKSMFKKVKNFFHIGNQTENVENEDLLNAKKIVNNTNATNALFEAQRLIEDETAISILMQNAMGIFHETPVLRNPEVNALFDEMFEVRGKLIDNRWDKPEQSEIRESARFSEFQKRSMMMSPMMIKNGCYKVKSHKYLAEEEMQATNFLLKKYKHQQKFRLLEDGNMTVDYQFEDEKAQHLYEEVQKVYATLKMQREDCALYEKEKQANVDKVAQSIAKSEKCVSGK